MNWAQRLLQLAVPLVRTHGFTRAALVEAAFTLHHDGAQVPATSASSANPDGSTSTSNAPGLGVREADAAIDALFGKDADEPRKALVQAWLEAGVNDMSKQSLNNGVPEPSPVGHGAKMDIDADVQRRIGEVLKRRLRWNEPVLRYLPEAFALLSTPPTPSFTRFLPSLPTSSESSSSSSPTSSLSSLSNRVTHLAGTLGAFALPPDPRPALVHAATVADEACYVAGDESTGTDWYTRRAMFAAAYSAAELHQLRSPHTAEAFLDSLLASGERAGAAMGEVSEFAGYLERSAKGIVRSWGVL